jgi:hypothetical protein
MIKSKYSRKKYDDRTYEENDPFSRAVVYEYWINLFPEAVLVGKLEDEHFREFDIAFTMGDETFYLEIERRSEEHFNNCVNRVYKDISFPAVKLESKWNYYFQLDHLGTRLLCFDKEAVNTAMKEKKACIKTRCVRGVIEDFCHIKLDICTLYKTNKDYTELDRICQEKVEARFGKN